MFEHNVRNFAFIFSNKPFGALSYYTRWYSILSYSRWLLVALSPFSFYFAAREKVLTVFTIDRSCIRQTFILVSEFSVFMWQLSSVLLYFDKIEEYTFYADNSTKFYIHCQYLFWILNHICEIVLLVFSFKKSRQLVKEKKIIEPKKEVSYLNSETRLREIFGGKDMRKDTTTRIEKNTTTITRMKHGKKTLQQNGQRGEQDYDHSLPESSNELLVFINSKKHYGPVRVRDFANEN